MKFDFTSRKLSNEEILVKAVIDYSINFCLYHFDARATTFDRPLCCCEFSMQKRICRLYRSCHFEQMALIHRSGWNVSTVGGQAGRQQSAISNQPQLHTHTAYRFSSTEQYGWAKGRR